MYYQVAFWGMLSHSLYAFYTFTKNLEATKKIEMIHLVNSYLGFFDDLGFYYKKEALDLETIKQLFGAYVIET